MPKEKNINGITPVGFIELLPLTETVSQCSYLTIKKLSPVEVSKVGQLAAFRSLKILLCARTSLYNTLLVSAVYKCTGACYELIYITVSNLQVTDLGCSAQ